MLAQNTPIETKDGNDISELKQSELKLEMKPGTFVQKCNVLILFADKIKIEQKEEDFNFDILFDENTAQPTVDLNFQENTSFIPGFNVETSTLNHYFDNNR